MHIIHEDYEREHLKEFVYLQAAKLEEEARIIQEINEEERLPANITLIYPKIPIPDDVKDNALPF